MLTPTYVLSIIISLVDGCLEGIEGWEQCISNMCGVGLGLLAESQRAQREEGMSESQKAQRTQKTQKEEVLAPEVRKVYSILVGRSERSEVRHVLSYLNPDKIY